MACSAATGRASVYGAICYCGRRRRKNHLDVWSSIVVWGMSQGSIVQCRGAPRSFVAQSGPGPHWYSPCWKVGQPQTTGLLEWISWIWNPTPSLNLFHCISFAFTCIYLPHVICQMPLAPKVVGWSRPELRAQYSALSPYRMMLIISQDQVQNVVSTWIRSQG